VRKEKIPTREALKVRSYRSSDLTEAMLAELAHRAGVSKSSMHTLLIRRAYQRIK
jgi:hypothetical protein